MPRRLRKLFVDFWIVLVFGLAAACLAPQAHAGVIATDSGLAQDERARVRALVERPELAAALSKMGIVPQEAAARVDAMSDAEVLQLAGRLDAALAGGQLGDPARRRISVDVGPFADFSQLVRFEDAANSIGATGDISIKRFSGGRARIDVAVSEPVDLLRELEESCIRKGVPQLRLGPTGASAHRVISTCLS